MASEKLPVIDYRAADQRRRSLTWWRRAVSIAGRMIAVLVVLVGILAIQVSLAPHPDWDWSLGAIIITVGVALFVGFHYVGR